MPKNFLTYIICKNENNGQAFAGTFTLRLYNSYNHTHAPESRPARVAESNSKCSTWKTVEAECSCSGLIPFQREVTTNEIQEKINIEREQQYKSAHVSALTGSVPECYAKWPRAAESFNTLME